MIESLSHDSRNVKYLTILEKIATDVVPIKSSRIAAAVVMANEIVSYGTNNRKSHPFQARFAKHEHAIYWHAECNAIYNAIQRLRVSTLHGATLFVARVRYSDQTKKRRFIWAESMPCPGCFRAIDEYDIRNVVFTTGAFSYDFIEAET